MLTLTDLQVEILDPPPIIQLKMKDESEDSSQYMPYHDYIANGDRRNYLQSPHLFVQAVLQTPTGALVNNELVGTTVSSLHALKDVHNSRMVP